MEHTLVSVEAAERLISDQRKKAAICEKAYTEAGPERLAEDLIADRDFPPFDRVAMDGIAIRYSSWEKGQTRFQIAGLQSAGTASLLLANEKDCIEVMTGAMLPEGTDTVIPYEQIKIADGFAELSDQSVEEGRHIHRQASDHQKGDIIVTKGNTMYAAEWAVAASIGKSKVKVFQRPKIAVIATGSELVDIDKAPKPYQIRRSNDLAILSSLRQHHFTEVSCFHYPDDEKAIGEALEKALATYDVVIFTGGVSMGTFDFLPRVFQQNGVRQIFHKVKQKPGKPLYFGVAERQQMVFGLPGNPVSAIICFHRFVLPALKGARPRPLTAKLTEDLRFKKPFTLFQPIKLCFKKPGELWAEPVRWNGSGDFAALCQTDGFSELTAEREHFAKGEPFPLWLWRPLDFF